MQACPVLLPPPWLALPPFPIPSTGGLGPLLCSHTVPPPHPGALCQHLGFKHHLYSQDTQISGFPISCSTPSLGPQAGIPSISPHAGPLTSSWLLKVPSIVQATDPSPLTSTANLTAHSGAHLSQLTQNLTTFHHLHCPTGFWATAFTSSLVLPAPIHPPCSIR